jgi:microcystin-dependent protein
MGQPFVGEIRMFGGNFAPAGWMTCDGQLLPISENDVLFNLIGTTYGGDGQSTFALPNLAARVPVHMGTGPGGTQFSIGQNGGTPSVTLTTNQLPSHTHALVATSSGQQQTPAANTLPADAVPGNSEVYGPVGSALTQLVANTIGPSGGSQPHDNMQPYLVITFIISMFGIFPTPS